MAKHRKAKERKTVVSDIFVLPFFPIIRYIYRIFVTILLLIFLSVYLCNKNLEVLDQK